MIGALLTAALVGLALGAAGAALAGLVRPEHVRRAVATLAAGFAFAGGVAWVDAWPALPPHDAVDWVVWVAVVASILGSVAVWRAPATPVRVVGLALLGLSVAWLLTEPLVPHALDGPGVLLTVAVAGAGLFLLGAPAGIVEPRRARALSRVPALIASAGAVLVIGFSSSRHLAELAAVLVGVLIGAFAVPAIARRARPTTSLAPVPGVTLGALLFGAYAYAQLDPMHGALLVGCALCALIDRPSGWKTAVLRTALATASAAVAVLLAHHAASERWHGLF